MTHTTKPLFRSKLTVIAALATLSLFAVVGCNDKSTTGPEEEETPTREQLIAEGQTVFEESCVACHGHSGEGESGPPLLHSDYLIAQRMRPVRILLMGLPNPIDTNPIVVNGIQHENTMFAIGADWDNRKIAGVVTYLRAVLNDSTSTNCTVSENEDGQLVSDCDIVKSPAEATTEILPSEVKALRDSLDAAGLLNN